MFAFFAAASAPLRWSLATVGTSNDRHVFRVRETTECGRARQLAVAVGDFHTARGFPDSLDEYEQ
jgi:hypothetical protein